MDRRTTRTIAYFTCRWLVIILAIFLFLHSGIRVLYAQETGEQAVTTELGREPDNLSEETETVTENISATTEENTSSIYDVIFEELNLDELERALNQEGIATSMPVSEMVKKQVEGDSKSVFSALFATISQVFFGELQKNKSLLL